MKLPSKQTLPHKKIYTCVGEDQGTGRTGKMQKREVKFSSNQINKKSINTQ